VTSVPPYLTPIPVQMRRGVTIAALACFQTQRLFPKPLGLVPLPRLTPGKRRRPPAHHGPRGVHRLVQRKAKTPDFALYLIVVSLLPQLQSYR
jgi:hypothetical protein